ncbi:hypothetical protein [Flammeovirga sp. SJP92]|uniref:hypothetical protein n=1 Tax=Flammeovirga sp. SJP92 TaxID=1775430 RepID=UPI0007897AAB|nr:hypothetical protein [Flammeovirga sp. SJP92]KXX70358.1 hypothetical protein AVL50_12185 [Flammeovirga sp. SJP92]
MKQFFQKSLLITLLFTCHFAFAQIQTDYPLLASFYSNGGHFEDKIQLYIVEFRHTSEVNVSVSYDKTSGDLILKFMDKSGSEHREVLHGYVPKYNANTPSVITFYKENDKKKSVSITEYNGGLSVIWNGEEYHMTS